MAQDEPMFLGIDGGGTRCRARLVDADGRVLGAGLSGASNLGLGIPVAAVAIMAAAEAALAQAGVDPGRWSAVRAGFGLAGANVPELVAALADFPFPFASTVVASDAVAACLGAHGGRDGGILILGTGSQGVCVSAGHATAVGGWGFALSDDASGAALGRALVRAALLAVDGLGPSSPLTDSVMAGFGGSPAAAVLWARGATPRDYATHAPTLFEAARDGDEVGRAIVATAAAQVEGFMTRLTVLGAERLALMGGLAQPYEPWLADAFRARLVAPDGDALDGAIRMARNGAPR